MKFGFAILALALNPLAALGLPIPGPVGVPDPAALPAPGNGGWHRYGHSWNHPTPAHSGPTAPLTTIPTSQIVAGSVVLAGGIVCAVAVCRLAYPHVKKAAGYAKDAVVQAATHTAAKGAEVLVGAAGVAKNLGSGAVHLAGTVVRGGTDTLVGVFKGRDKKAYKNLDGEQVGEGIELQTIPGQNSPQSN